MDGKTPLQVLMLLIAVVIIPDLIVSTHAALIVSTHAEDDSSVFYSHRVHLQEHKAGFVYYAGLEQLMFHCFMLIYGLMLLSTGPINSKLTASIQQELGINFFRHGKCTKYYLSESIVSRPTSVLDVMKDVIDPKRATVFASKKRDIFSSLFTPRQNLKQKLCIFPASLQKYLHERETIGNTAELMKYEWARYATFKTFPLESPAMPMRLASNGFYYNGDKDSVTCFSCRLQYQGWKDADVVSEVHAKLSPDCKFLKGIDFLNIGIHSDESQGAVGGAHTDSDDLFNSTDIYIQRQCRESELKESTSASRRQHKCPDYENYHHRMDTFTCWPYSDVIEPCVLADAGFFSVGLGDCTRCFSCGGGLRNWEYGDGPWEEHARWFPWCRFLREMKGADFVRKHADEPNMEATLSKDANEARRGSYVDNFEEKSVFAKSSDTYNQLQTEKSTAESLKALASVKRTLSNMGFSEANIDKMFAQKNQQDIANISDATMATLIDELLVTSEPPKTKSEPSSPIASPSKLNKEPEGFSYQANDDLTINSPDNSSTDSESELKMLRGENLELKHRLTCKICMDKESNIIVIPCGHVACCEECSSNIRKCVICRRLIKSRVKAFMG